MFREHFLPRARAVGLIGVVLLSGCAKQFINPPFYQQYREKYAITADELKTLQFYISQEVLAHAITGSSDTDPGGVIIVPIRTPGLVREVGPDWLRVAFREGGEGVLFRRRDDRPEAVYALATATEQGGIALVSELPKPVVRQGERRYEVIQGASAYLIVSGEDLDRLIKSRPHAGGLERKK